jgi:hypothetical protein
MHMDKSLRLFLATRDPHLGYFEGATGRRHPIPVALYVEMRMLPHSALESPPNGYAINVTHDG